MTDSIKNNLEWIPGEYKAPRVWRDEEIKEATNYIKTKRPGVWQELLREEEETHDLTNLDATGIAKSLLREIYEGKDIDPMDIIELFGCIRDVLETEISDKNSHK